MAGRGRKSMVTCAVQITWPSDVDILAPFQRGLEGGLEALADRVVARADANLAPHDRTGNTRKSIRKIKGKDGLTWYVRAGGTSKVRTAHLLEFGAGRHPITPESKGKKLRFWASVGRSGGQTVIFARRVDHPGVAANPYLRPAFDEVMSQAGSTVKKEMGL